MQTEAEEPRAVLKSMGKGWHRISQQGRGDGERTQEGGREPSRPQRPEAPSAGVSQGAAKTSRTSKYILPRIRAERGRRGGEWGRGGVRSGSGQGEGGEGASLGKQGHPLKSTMDSNTAKLTKAMSSADAAMQLLLNNSALGSPPPPPVARIPLAPASALAAALPQAERPPKAALPPAALPRAAILDFPATHSSPTMSESPPYLDPNGERNAPVESQVSRAGGIEIKSGNVEVVGKRGGGGGREGGRGCERGGGTTREVDRPTASQRREPVEGRHWQKDQTATPIGSSRSQAHSHASPPRHTQLEHMVAHIERRVAVDVG